MAASSKRYSPGVHKRVVRWVFEHRHEYGTQWAAIESISKNLRMTPQTLRTCARPNGMRGSVDDDA
jgi:transposase